MVISRKKNPHNNMNINIKNKQIERVQKYKYLGCWLHETWDSNKEIKHRLEMARAAFMKYEKKIRFSLF